MPAAIARWLVPLLVLFTAVLIVWIRLRFLEIPLGRNEGAYGYLGAEVLRGSVPFRDFYEMKPLGLYFSYALFVGVFGQSSAALHLATPSSIIPVPTSSSTAAQRHGAQPLQKPCWAFCKK